MGTRGDTAGKAAPRLLQDNNNNKSQLLQEP